MKLKVIIALVITAGAILFFKFHSERSAAPTLQELNEQAQEKQQAGDFAGAKDIWQQAAAARPNNPLPFASLAALYHRDLADYALAEKNYLLAIANDAAGIPTIRNLFELYYYTLKNYSKAEALLLKSIDDNPQAADLYALAGSFYNETGSPEKALAYYKKYLELNPENQAVKAELERLQ